MHNFNELLIVEKGNYEAFVYEVRDIMNLLPPSDIKSIECLEILSVIQKGRPYSYFTLE